jgi:hypothetical protein
MSERVMRMSEYLNAFPGYEYKEVDGMIGKQNMYRGTNLGFGGYVYFEPGIYDNVALLDIQSLHPHSIIAMNKFGEYTKRYQEILDTRIAIKNHDYEAASKMLNGAFARYLTSDEEADNLATACKLILNSTYGYCSANFENPFLDSRDTNNTVALRGALFMRTLQDEVTSRGFTVCHIKTDSIKIPNATPELIEFVMGFANKYGYVFEHEASYDRMCLVNGSTYIAKYASEEKCQKLYGYTPKENRKHPEKWTATAKQFQVPYVFKTLFSKEPIEFDDLCETFEVKTALYLDKNEDLPEGEHDYHFIGRVGRFCPIKPGCGGGELLREGKDAEGNQKFSAATGSKGYRWLEAEMVKELGKEGDIDLSYYNKLVDDAVDAVSEYGDFEMFASEDTYIVMDRPPWEEDETTAFDVR